MACPVSKAIDTAYEAASKARCWRSNGSECAKLNAIKYFSPLQEALGFLVELKHSVHVVYNVESLRINIPKKSYRRSQRS